MFEIVERVDWVYGHRLKDHDGPCRFLHGHNGAIELVLAAEHLDEMGFVMDLGEVNQIVSSDLRANFDHRMLLHQEDSVIPHLEAAGEVFIPLPFHPTAENLAKMLFDRYRQRGIPLVEVRLFEMAGSWACYRP
jgi:6-pyruvoyltetrahydropterin/6-carboxytetrahydropterin synthase